MTPAARLRRSLATPTDRAIARRLAEARLERDVSAILATLPDHPAL